MGKAVKTLHIDRVGEYCADYFKACCKKVEIKQQKMTAWSS